MTFKTLKWPRLSVGALSWLVLTLVLTGLGWETQPATSQADSGWSGVVKLGEDFAGNSGNVGQQLWSLTTGVRPTDGVAYIAGESGSGTDHYAKEKLLLGYSN